MRCNYLLIKTHVINTRTLSIPCMLLYKKKWFCCLGGCIYPHFCFPIFTAVLCICATVPHSHLVLKELSFEQRVNSKELAFTWLSRCCYGREARQRKKKPPSLRLSLIPIFILSIYIPPPLLPRSLALPESLAGWKSKWLMRAHSSCSLPLSIFSNATHSLSPLLSETSPFLLLPSVQLFISSLFVSIHFFSYLEFKN